VPQHGWLGPPQVAHFPALHVPPVVVLDEPQTALSATHISA
jgi:hypothetical protein